MIDFHIQIGPKAFSVAQAIIYAKSASLKAFGLIFQTNYIPSDDVLSLYESDTKNPHHIVVEQIKNYQKEVRELSIYYNAQAFFGIELKHIPPALLEQAILAYRHLGIDLIGVYGETICDIVEIGTNFAACNAKADILFNPGLIDDVCMEIAAQNNVRLELSSHSRHAYCNGHIAQLAKKHNAKLILGSSASTLEEIYNPDMQKNIVLGAGTSMQNIDNFSFFNTLQTKSF